MKRIDPSVDFLIKGGPGSKLFGRAFPMAEKNNPRQLGKSLDDMIFTVTGKTIESGKPWFRWTLICNSAERLLKLADRGNCL